VSGYFFMIEAREKEPRLPDPRRVDAVPRASISTERDMEKLKNRHSLLIRTIALVVVCLFTANTVSMSYPGSIEVKNTETLQVPSIFKPILDIAGWENDLQVKVELACMLAMALGKDGMPFQDINSEVDKWLSAVPGAGRSRMLEVLTDPARSDEDEEVLEFVVGFLGKEEGPRFRVTSSKNSAAEIQADEKDISIELIEEGGPVSGSITEKENEWPDTPSEEQQDPVAGAYHWARHIAEILRVLSESYPDPAGIWVRDPGYTEPVRQTFFSWLTHGPIVTFISMVKAYSDPDFRGVDTDQIEKAVASEFLRFKEQVETVIMLMKEACREGHLEKYPDVVFTEENPAHHENVGVHFMKGMLSVKRDEKERSVTEAISLLEGSLKKLEEYVVEAAGPLPVQERKKTRKEAGQSMEERKPRVIESPLDKIPEEDIKNIFVFGSSAMRLNENSVPKLGETAIDMWPVVTGLHDKYPEAVIYVATYYPDLFLAEQFGGKIKPIPRTIRDAFEWGYNIRDWHNCLLDQIGGTYSMSLMVRDTRKRFIRDKRIDMIVDVTKMGGFFNGPVPERFGDIPRPHIITMNAATMFASAVDNRLYQRGGMFHYTDRDGNFYNIKGMEDILESRAPGGEIESAGIWKISMDMCGALGLDVGPDNLCSIKLGIEESVGAINWLRDAFYEMNPDASIGSFDINKKIVVVNVYAVTQFDLLTPEQWVEAIVELIRNTRDAYFVFTHGGEMDYTEGDPDSRYRYIVDIVNEVRNKLKDENIGGLSGSDVILPKRDIYPYINAILGIAAGLVTLDTGLSHLGSGVYDIPTAVITTEGILHWLTPRDNVHTIMARTSESVKAERALRQYPYLPDELAQKLQRMMISGMHASTLQIREQTRAFAEALNEASERPAARDAKIAASSISERDKLDTELVADRLTNPELDHAERDLRRFVEECVEVLGIDRYLEERGIPVDELYPEVIFVDSSMQTGRGYPQFKVKLSTPGEARTRLLVDRSALEAVMLPGGKEALRIKNEVKGFDIIHEIMGHMLARKVFRQFSRIHSKKQRLKETKRMRRARTEEEILARLMGFLAVHMINAKKPDLIDGRVRSLLGKIGVDVSTPNIAAYLEASINDIKVMGEIENLDTFRYRSVLLEDQPVSERIKKHIERKYIPAVRKIFGFTDGADAENIGELGVLAANIFTGRYAWLRNLPVRVLGLLTLATPVHEIGHIRASLNFGGRLRESGWGLFKGMFTGRVHVERGPPAVHYAGYAMNILSGLVAGAASLMLAAFSLHAPAVALSAVSAVHLFYALAEQIGGRHGRGDITDLVKWKAKHKVSEEEAARLAREQEMTGSKAGAGYHIVGGLKSPLYSDLRYLMGKGFLARRMSEEVYYPGQDRGDSIIFAEYAAREVKNVIDDLVRARRGKIRILDIGCGTGISSITAVHHAKKYAAELGIELDIEMDSIDISRKACENTLFNFNEVFPHLIGGEDRLRVINVQEGSEFRQLEGLYDLILFNAPDPASDEDDPEHKAISIRSSELKRLVSKASRLLPEKGVFLLRNRALAYREGILPRNIHWDMSLAGYNYENTDYRDTFTGTRPGNRSSAYSLLANLFTGRMARLKNLPMRILGALTLSTFAHEMGHLALAAIKGKYRQVRSTYLSEASYSRKLMDMTRGKSRDQLRWEGNKLVRAVRSEMRKDFLLDLFFRGEVKGVDGAAGEFGGILGNLAGIIAGFLWVPVAMSLMDAPLIYGLLSALPFGVRTALEAVIILAPAAMNAVSMFTEYAGAPFGRGDMGWKKPIKRPRFRKKDKDGYFLKEEEAEKYVERLSLGSNVFDRERGLGPYGRLYGELEGIMRDLLKADGLDPGRFQLHLVDDHYPNGAIYPFSGHVIMNLGAPVLLNERGKLTKDAMASFIGHEIGHIIQRKELLRKGKITKRDILENKGINDIERYLSDYTDEYDADIRGVDLLSRAGYNALSSLSMPEEARFYALKRSGDDPACYSHPAMRKRIEQLRQHLETAYIGDVSRRPEKFSAAAVLELKRRTGLAEISNEAFNAGSHRETLSLVGRAADIRELVSALMLARTEQETQKMREELALKSAERALEMAGGDMIMRLVYFAVVKAAIEGLDRGDHLHYLHGKGAIDEPRDWDSARCLDGLFGRVLADAKQVLRTPGDLEILFALYEKYLDGDDPAWRVQVPLFEEIMMGHDELPAGVREHYELSMDRLGGFFDSILTYGEAAKEIRGLMSDKIDVFSRGILRKVAWKELIRFIETLPNRVECRKAIESLILERSRTMTPADLEEFLYGLPAMDKFSTAGIKGLPVRMVRGRPELLKALYFGYLGAGADSRQGAGMRSEVLSALHYNINHDVFERFVSLIAGTSKDPVEAVKDLIRRFSWEAYQHRLWSVTERLFAHLKSSGACSDTDLLDMTEVVYSLLGQRAERDKVDPHDMLRPGEVSMALMDILPEEPEEALISDLNSRVLALMKSAGIAEASDLLPESIHFKAGLYLFANLLFLKHYKQAGGIELLEGTSGYHDGSRAAVKKVVEGLSPSEKLSTLRALARVRAATSEKEPSSVNSMLHYLELASSLGVKEEDLPVREGTDLTQYGESYHPFRFFGEMDEAAYRAAGNSLYKLASRQSLESMMESHDPGGDLLDAGMFELLKPLADANMSFEDIVDRVTTIIPPGVFRNHVLFGLWLLKVYYPRTGDDAPVRSRQWPRGEHNAGRLRRFAEEKLSGEDLDKMLGSAELIIGHLVRDKEISTLNRSKMARGAYDSINPSSMNDLFDEDSYNAAKQRYKDILFYEPGTPAAHVDVLLGELFRKEILERLEDDSWTFQEKAHFICRYLTRPTAARDEYMVKLMEKARDPADLEMLIPLFFSRMWKDRAGVDALELEIRRDRESFAGFDHAFSRVLHYFSEPSLTRDDLMQQLVNDLEVTLEDIEKVNTLMLRSHAKLDEEGTQRYFAGSDLFDELVAQLDLDQKTALLLWLMDIRDRKPEFLMRFEWDFSVSFDRFREIFRRREGYFQDAGKSARERFLRPFFDMDEGIVSSPEGRVGFVREICASLGIDTGEESVFWNIVRGALSLDPQGFYQRDQARQIQKRVMMNISNRWPDLKAIKTLTEEEQEARLTRVMLESSGVVGVKIGQFLSRTELVDVGEMTRRDLARLKEQAEPINKGTAMTLINALREASGESPLKVIRLLGSASVKCVYMAEEKVGNAMRQVAVKLKRPEVKVRIDNELWFFESVIKDLAARGDISGELSASMVKQVREMITSEMDFKREAENQKRMAGAASSTQRGVFNLVNNLLRARPIKVRIPNATRVYTDQMMVEEYIDALSLGEITRWEEIYKEGYDLRGLEKAVDSPDPEELEDIVLRLTGEQDEKALARVNKEIRNLVAKTTRLLEKGGYGHGRVDGLLSMLPELRRRIAADLLKQVFVDGLYHLDPHEGNILIPIEGDTVNYIDMGAVGKLSVRNRAMLWDLSKTLQMHGGEEKRSAAARFIRAYVSAGVLAETAGRAEEIAVSDEAAPMKVYRLLALLGGKRPLDKNAERDIAELRQVLKFFETARYLLESLGPVRPPMGGGMHPEGLAEYARKDTTAPADLIQYLVSTGLFEQVGVIRKALRSDPRFSEKLDQFEKMIVLFEPPHRHVEKARSVLKVAFGKAAADPQISISARVIDISEIIAGINEEEDKWEVISGLSQLILGVDHNAFLGESLDELDDSQRGILSVSWANGLAKNRGAVAVKENGDIVGYASLVMENRDNMWNLEKLGVIEGEYRKKGLATALLDRAFKNMLAEGTRSAKLRISATADENDLNYSRYFAKRGLNSGFGVNGWYLEAKEFREASYVVTVHAGHREEDMMREIEKIVSGTDSRSDLLSRRVRNYLKDAEKHDKAIPIDIPVDLSLMSEKEMEEYAETWAYLILSVSELKNINFMFEIPDLDGKGGIPERILYDIDECPQLSVFLGFLKDEIRSRSTAFGLDLDVEGFLRERINRPRREGAVEVQILSKEWLVWARKEKLELKDNQYPVALDGLTSIKDQGLCLRNFEAAMAIGLSKAALAIAKRRDEQKAEDEEKELPKLREEILSKMQKLYSVFFEDRVRLTEDTLNNMIHNRSSVRMNLAISLALPPITRLAVEKLQAVHEQIQLALQAA